MKKLTAGLQSSLPLRKRGIRLQLVLILSFFCCSLFAQTGTLSVSGKVVDKDSAHVPLAGVSIVVKGSTRGTVTNADGEFTLQNIPSTAKLVFSFTNYESREMEARNITAEDPIEMENKASELNDVVVTGYQTVKKKLFTGSSATLNAKDVERAGMPDISRMLEGQFAGVAIQNVSGTFGAAPKLRIRGATSLSGDNKPLWVIDGVILEDPVNISNEALSTGDMNTLLGSSVAGLNPDDIQDITILKDAAATSLYGARAMNGVISVTTKKGKSSANGKAFINYSGNFSRYIKPNYSNFDILNSADQMVVMNELRQKGYYQMPGTINGTNGGIFYKMYRELYDYDPATDSYTLKQDAPSENQFLSRYANANTDWFDIIFKNSFMQEHSLSVSSGTENFQTYGSTSYLRDEGQTVGNNVERYTGRFRLNFKAGKKISGELMTFGSVRNQRAPGSRAQQSEPVYGSYLRGFDINPYNYAVNTSRMLTAYDENGNLEYFRSNFAPFNIINELNTNYLTLNQMEFTTLGSLGYKIIPGLDYKFLGSYTYTKSENQVHILENSNLAQAYRAVTDPTTLGSNEYLYTNPDVTYAYPFSVLPEGGFYNVNMNNSKSYYMRNDLNFVRDFGLDHSVRVYGAWEMRSVRRQEEFFDGVGYQYENGGLVNPYYMYFKQAQESGKPYFGMKPTIDRFMAYLMSGSYAYQRKYVIEANVRYDGSNKMGRSRTARWLPTWNISGKWNIDQEAFWPQNDIFTTAALRASYGLVGNIGNATNTAATFYNMIARRPYINDKETLTFINSLENSELTWEKTKDFNIGTDFSLFNNKVSFTADYYVRKIKDLIGIIKTSGIGGEAEKAGNYATMDGRGLEFTIGLNKIVSSGDFTWSARLNYALNKNKITKLTTDPNIWKSVSPDGAAILGHPQRGLFSIPFVGLNHDFGYPTYIGIGDKDPTTYVNLQSTNVLNLKYEGPIDPVHTGGIYNTFQYKGFTLTALFKGSAGNKLRLSPRFAWAYSDMASMPRDVLNRWMMPGDEKYTTIPALIDAVTATQITDNLGGQVSAVYPYNLYNYSSERVVDGYYIKLSSLQLFYALSKNLVKRIGINNAQLGLVANNIWTIYADKRLNGQDPEFISAGGVALPSAKQVTLSLKVGF